MSNQGETMILAIKLAALRVSHWYNMYIGTWFPW